MPRYDGTGPMGRGPGTGWGMGPCGNGRGFSRRRFFSRKEESEMLKEEADVLEEELKAVKERLAEIKDQK